MTIHALRILPPLAIARLGSGATPVDNYTLEDDPDNPLDFRRIVPAPTLVVDPESGEIREARTPEAIEFTELDDPFGTGEPIERIRPVAPFLEVFALTDGDRLEPLTLDLLKQHGVDASAVTWRVTVANRKVARRTDDAKDLVSAETDWFSDHAEHRLDGQCPNFIEGGTIDFGRVRYVKPNAAFPEVRLRFTPAKGYVYGTDVSKLPADKRNAPDRKRPGDPALGPGGAVYDPTKGTWYGYEAPVGAIDNLPDYHGPFHNETLPPSLFAIVPPAPSWLHGDVARSRGYFDDACDGIVEVSLALGDGTRLEASARVTAGPPMVVPDALFVRSLTDDLEQIVHGPDVADDEPIAVTRARAEDIVRRAYETVRFFNVAVMNGASYKGRPALSLDTMPAEEAFDTERPERPVFSQHTSDTLAVLGLHQQLYTALRAGTAAWFLRFLRRPEEAADYTDRGRRKMPALMCGADNNYLALTYRQLDTIARAALGATFEPPLGSPAPAPAAESAAARPALSPRNRTAQLNYAAAGNPPSTRPETAIANCTPGLEVDFRAVWRRLFVGIVLREYDNLVVDAEPAFEHLKGQRLLRVNGQRVMAQKLGPSPADPTTPVVLVSEEDPSGVAPLEWSNALARVLRDFSGESVECDFTSQEEFGGQVWWDDDDAQGPPHQKATLDVRRFFEDDTAVIARALAEPGELTQGLCSPWQNDYRECSCYYWASARPDYVNVEPAPDGTSRGDNWLQKKRTGDYVPDDYVDTRLVLYDDLFDQWEHWLRFQVRGRDLPPGGKAGGAAP